MTLALDTRLSTVQVLRRRIVMSIMERVTLTTTSEQTAATLQVIDSVNAFVDTTPANDAARLDEAIDRLSAYLTRLGN